MFFSTSVLPGIDLRWIPTQRREMWQPRCRGRCKKTLKMKAGVPRSSFEHIPLS